MKPDGSKQDYLCPCFFEWSSFTVKTCTWYNWYRWFAEGSHHQVPVSEQILGSLAKGSACNIYTTLHDPYCNALSRGPWPIWPFVLVSRFNSCTTPAAWFLAGLSSTWLESHCSALCAKHFHHHNVEHALWSSFNKLEAWFCEGFSN